MQFAIGQPNPRTEDPRLVKGGGLYADDVNLDGQLWGAVLRSPHAHAAIAGIDCSEARRGPGVRLVLTNADLEAEGIGSLPFTGAVTNRDGSPIAAIPHPVLAAGRVRHVGEPVVFVVAESREAARDACEAVHVDYHPLDAVTGTAGALADDAPQLWEEAPGNVVLDWEVGDAAAVRSAFATAERVVELEVVNNRVVVAPLEPRAAVGDYEPGNGRFTLHACSQGAHKLAAPLARDVLKVPGDRLRVLTGDVGGAFGMKNFLFHEYVLVLVAARRLQRPVKWTADRSESFVSDLQGRDRVMRGRMAFDSACRIVALEVDVIASFGAYVSQFMPFVATLAATAIQSMAYRIPAIHTRVRGVMTNTVPIDAYRGAGRPETGFMVERLLDLAARRFGLSGSAIRRLNHVRQEDFPWDTGVGVVYDCGDFGRHLDRALELADVAGFPARRKESARRGVLRGLGVTGVFDRCGGMGPDMVDLDIDSEGHVVARVGTQTNGQGHETAYTQIIADRLKVDPSRIRILQGDNELVPFGSGNGGSNFIAIAGSACLIAVGEAIDKGRRIAAHLLETAPDDIVFEDGVFRIDGTDRTLTFEEVAAGSADPDRLAQGEDPGWRVSGTYKPPDGPAFPNGTHVCELEVDPETGVTTLKRYVAVDDAGVVINPLLVDGQMHGGVVQGIGQALAEEALYDPGSGQLLTGSFLDYQLPRASDLVMIETDRIEVPTARNLLGVKGIGETGAIGSPPAVINALVDALAPLGIDHIDMPATPLKVWQAIRNAPATARGGHASGHENHNRESRG